MLKLPTTKLYVWYKRYVKLSFLTFLSSLFFVGIYNSSGNGYVGALLLFFGWLGDNPTWIANPFYIGSLFFRKPKFIMIVLHLEVIALFFASFVLFDKEISLGWDSTARIGGFGLGYYLWILAMAILLTGDVARYRNRKRVLTTQHRKHTKHL